MLKKYLILLKPRNTMNNLFKKEMKNHKASKTVKNPNNGDIKSVTDKQLKTASNLLKPIKQSYIITQELKIVKNQTFFKWNQLP